MDGGRGPAPCTCLLALKPSSAACTGAQRLVSPRGKAKRNPSDAPRPPTGMAGIKRTGTGKCWRGRGEVRPSCTAGGDGKCAAAAGEPGVPWEVKGQSSYAAGTSPPWSPPWRRSRVHAAGLTAAKRWKPPGCLSTTKWTNSVAVPMAVSLSHEEWGGVDTHHNVDGP